VAGFETRLEALEDALRHEQQLPPGERRTAASDAALARAVDSTGRARLLLADGDAAGASRLLDEAAHLATDSWSYTSELAAEVVAVAQAARRLRTRPGG
jgi:hypothetical protein